MLTQLEISDIRLFRGTGWKFEFPQLTVLCGTNGAGKSTVLQTLLFLHENLLQNNSNQDFTESETLKLISGQVDLGDYADWVSNGDVFEDISIAVTVGTFRLQIELGLSEQALESNPVISMLRRAHSFLNFDPHSEARTEFKWLRDELKRLVSPPDRPLETQNPDAVDSYLYLEDVSARHSVNQVIENLSYLSNSNLITSELLDQTRELLSQAAVAEARTTDKLANCVLKHLQLSTMADRPTVWNMNDLDYLPGNLLYHLLRQSEDIIDDIEHISSDLRKMNRAYSSMSHVLRNIRYIGPQRAPAKRYYLTSEIPQKHVFDAEGTSVPYLLSQDQLRNKKVDSVPPLKTKVRKQGLMIAVNEWLYYLRTGKEPTEKLAFDPEVEVTVAQGVLIELKLHGTAPNKRHALIDSGFGYSQVLPILIQGLLAERGSAVIIEQPELHLNPALQVRVAEFLVSLLHAGKQVIVETHSEHIVNTIRVLIAEDKSGTLASKSDIYYFGTSQGKPNITKLSIKADGTVPDWPPSFFGEASTLATRLLKAQREYRQRRQ